MLQSWPSPSLVILHLSLDLSLSSILDHRGDHAIRFQFCAWQDGFRLGEVACLNPRPQTCFQVAPDRRGIDWDKMRKHPNIIGYSLLMASFAFGNGVIGVSMPGSHEVQVTYAAFATVVLSVLAFRWLPRQLAMCNFYMFISNVLYINIGGAQVTEGLATSSDCCTRACNLPKP